MESPVLGLVLDSSAAIHAERNKQAVADFIEAIIEAHGPVALSLSPVSVSELVHGIYRAHSPEVALRRRQFVEELTTLVPIHPITARTAWLAGEIEGRQAARGVVLPFSDLMIGAAALEQDYAVLTGNRRHFEMIPGLTVVAMG